jgi:hypothetical protein
VKPKLESLWKEVFLEMKLPLQQKQPLKRNQPQKMGSEAAASTHPSSLALGQKLPTEEKSISDRCCPAVHRDTHLVLVLCCTVLVYKPLCILNKQVLSSLLSGLLLFHKTAF